MKDEDFQGIMTGLEDAIAVLKGRRQPKPRRSQPRREGDPCQA
jgi:hypothetical protein